MLKFFIYNLTIIPIGEKKEKNLFSYGKILIFKNKCKEKRVYQL